MPKPGSKNPKKRYAISKEAIEARLVIINGFLNGKKILKDVFDDKVDDDYKLSIQWQELQQLRLNMNRLGFILLLLPLVLRLTLIMRSEILGVSKRHFSKYKISTDMLSKLSGYRKLKQVENMKLAEIRSEATDVLDPSELQSIPGRVYALISLHSRIPYLWLLHENIERKWDTMGFELLNPQVLNRKELIQLLMSCDLNNHQVIAVKLALSNRQLFLRIENIKGTVLIEIYNFGVTSEEIYYVERSLSYYCVNIGYRKTVVPQQINPTFVWRHPLSTKLIAYPNEYIGRSVLK